MICCWFLAMKAANLYWNWSHFLCLKFSQRDTSVSCQKFWNHFLNSFSNKRIKWPNVLGSLDRLWKRCPADFLPRTSQMGKNLQTAATKRFIEKKKRKILGVTDLLYFPAGLQALVAEGILQITLKWNIIMYTYPNHALGVIHCYETDEYLL